MPAPNFLIIGERRSGTTSLARWIECHPEIFLHPQMDIGYFVDKELVGSKNWKMGPADYSKWEGEHSKEEYLSYFEQVEDQKAIGEKSADYLFLEPCHQRIKEYLPNIKLVITLRDPLERAWSMYWNEVGKGRETLSFEAAVEQEAERVANSDYARDHLSYVSRGFYDQSLKTLLKTFSKDQIHVFILEEVKENPKKYLSALYTFLDVDPKLGYDNVENRYNANWTSVPKPFVKNNKILATVEAAYFKGIQKLSTKILYRKNIYKRRDFQIKMAKPFRHSKVDFKMPQEVRARLLDKYKPHIQELEKMLKKDLSLWLRG